MSHSTGHVEGCPLKQIFKIRAHFDIFLFEKQNKPFSTISSSSHDTLKTNKLD